MEAYQKEWKAVTDSWPKAPVDWCCQHISPWKPRDPIPSKEGFEPPSREPSPPPVSASDLQVVASDTPQPMAIMPIAASEPTPTVATPAPTDVVSHAEFEELKALIHSRLPPLPPPPHPPATDTISRTEFLAFLNQMSSEFQGLLAFLKQNLPPPPPSPPQDFGKFWPAFIILPFPHSLPKLSHTFPAFHVSLFKHYCELGFGFVSSPINDDHYLSDTLPVVGLYYAIKKRYNNSLLSKTTSSSSDCDNTPSPFGSPHSSVFTAAHDYSVVASPGS
ncbi:hypothetical protein Fmac_011403 [Flemingia macrophylla]|uniref:Uncharacterized protein n=1 Tax=Flemingia macrophylla TaxID=520843 RepID=A0ABD1MMC7_9FABA